ncbi:hypothetical protein TNCV_2078991 [Trichonephila clavipes]|nr:hypothetical protein TNCV_2078991 [Trichonephila clavipes]
MSSFAVLGLQGAAEADDPFENKNREKLTDKRGNPIVKERENPFLLPSSEAWKSSRYSNLSRFSLNERDPPPLSPPLRTL